MKLVSISTDRQITKRGMALVQRKEAVSVPAVLPSGLVATELDLKNQWKRHMKTSIIQKREKNIE